MKWIVLRHKRLTAVLGLAAFLALIAFVNHPAFVGASGNTRQLPIYCVEKDYKVCALSFDAAWADG